MFHVTWVSDEGLGTEPAGSADEVRSLGKALLTAGATRIIVTEVMPDGSRHSVTLEEFVTSQTTKSPAGAKPAGPLEVRSG